MILPYEGSNPVNSHYIPKSFIIQEVELNDWGEITKVKKTFEYEEIEGCFKFENNNKFTFTFDENIFGGPINGRQYVIYYKTDYIPGKTLTNSLEIFGYKDVQGTEEKLTDETKKKPSFISNETGGSVEGDLKGQIKIIKVDGWDTTIKLEGAEFTIKKAGKNNPVIERKTTDVNGEAIFEKLAPGKYTIEETVAPQHYIKEDQEYTVTVSSDKLTRINIGNAPETIDIKVRKEWIGFEKPSIKVVLYANKVKVAEHELTAPSWEYTFKNFRKYDQNTGTEIIYTVDEEVVPTGYERSITGSPKDEFVITNKQKTIDIKGEKTWDDNNNAENKRPESITVILFANGKPIQNPEVRPDANGKWTYSFEGLQEYDSQGNKITYTIKEEPVPGYTSEVNGYNITNTYNPQNSGGGGSGGGQSGGGSGGTGGDDSNKPKPNDPKPNDPKPNDPKPSDDSTGMGGATPPDSSVMPDGSVVPNDSTTATNTVAPKNHKTPKNPVLTDKQGVKKTAQASRRLPKTGEGANPTLYAWMLGALGSMLVLVGYRKRKTVK